jgi:hypothetical protein
MALELPIDKIGDGIAPLLQHIPTVCELKGQDLFLWIILPLLIGLFLILLMLLRDTIKLKWFRVFATKGYIRVFMIKENKRIMSRIVKLDKFNNFQFPGISDRKFSLEKMYEFILGYDKYGFPVFLYDVNFILPLKIDNILLTQQIKSQLGITEPEKISAVTMKLDSSIYYTVYDKKLISDLYSISGGQEFKQKLIWILLIAAGIFVLYYTGILGQILEMVGVHGVAPATQNVINATVTK